MIEVFHPTATYHPEIPVDYFWVKKYERVYGPINFSSRSPNPHSKREMNLMKAGLKPCAMVHARTLRFWEKEAEEHGWIIEKPDSLSSVIIIASKEESWRITCLLAIYASARFIGIMTKDHHRAVGRLLGMTEEDVEEFHVDRYAKSDYVTKTFEGTDYLMV